MYAKGFNNLRTVPPKINRFTWKWVSGTSSKIKLN